MRILVVDDDEVVRNSVKMTLSEYNHDVACAGDARTAIAMLKKEKYDFILFDYLMPDKDGLWFLKHAKLPRETKALLMTAYGTPDLINQMLKHGAAGYLLKPFAAVDLLRQLEFHSSGEKTTPPA